MRYPDEEDRLSVDLEVAESGSDLPESVWDVSKDRRVIKFEVKGKDYQATKPKKWDEWLQEIAVSLTDSRGERSILTLERFGAKILGQDQFDALNERRFDDDDDVTYADIVQAMHDLFEVWTTEADQPIRPTGSRAGSSSGKKRTASK